MKGIDLRHFSCGDDDLDDFFHNNALSNAKLKLGNTYVVHTERTLQFYIHNGFTPLYASEELEREAFGVPQEERLRARMMYLDLGPVNKSAIL